jgi:hypothetical protein
MTDHEVGKLWTLAHDAKPSASDDLIMIRELIRKLVADRARTYKDVDILLAMQSRDDSEYINRALVDFNIDPTTWKETTNAR